MPEIIEPSGRPAGTVVYFTGCATNHIFERTGHVSIKVLTRMGYRVLLPKNQGCCGLPLFFHGGIKQAENTIISNKNHGQGKNMVENLLKQVPHVDYQKAEDWDSCCGGGGFFLNEYPEISKKIVDDKIKNAVNTGVQFWATGAIVRQPAPKRFA